MAFLGLSSVLGPAISWYSASQALAAGNMILAMLAALHAWRVRGSWWLMAAGLFAALAAPLFWSAGYSAGLVGWAYLWADGRRWCRRAAFLPLAASLATATLVWGIAGRAIAQTAHVTGRPLQWVDRFQPAVNHTAQAVCEALVLNNLGLDSATSADQALVIVLVLAIGWTWSRRRSNPAGQGSTLRVHPLEAAGAVLVFANFGLIFAARGTETTFDNLRALGWYDAIPQLGALLFVFGWWSGPLRSEPSASLDPPRFRELLAVLVLAAVMLLLQTPRVHRVIFQYDGLAAQVHLGGRDEVIRLRTPFDLAEQAERQRRALAELDRLERAGNQRGWDTAAWAEALSRISVPGMPEGLPGLKPVNLLNLSRKPLESE
jgi:hypothetical protein